jgi:hypothetical protein
MQKTLFCHTLFSTMQKINFGPHPFPAILKLTFWTMSCSSLAETDFIDLATIKLCLNGILDHALFHPF